MKTVKLENNSRIHIKEPTNGAERIIAYSIPWQADAWRDAVR